MAEVSHYIWDMGDGTPPIQEELVGSHTYREAGVYTVTRTVVYDNGNTLSFSRRVVAQAFNFESFSPDFSPVIYRYGRNEAEGIGVSEITGDAFPFQTFGCNALNIVDKSGSSRFVIFDNDDRKFYELTTVGGADGLGRSVVWKDKANIDGTSGTEYSASIDFRAVKGTYQRQFVEMMSANIYTRPVKLRRMGVGVTFSPSGYPENFNADVSVHADDYDGESATSLAVDLPKHRIHFDRRVEGELLQVRFIGNKAPHIVTGMNSNVILKDKLDSPQNRWQSEDGWQETLTDAIHWFTRGGEPNVDRVTGVSVDVITQAYDGNTPVVGADDYSGSAFEVLVGETLSFNGTEDYRAVFFYRSGIDVGSLPANTVNINVVGDWVFAETIGTDLVFGEGVFFDIRIYVNSSLPSNFDDGARTYLFKDVSSYNGKLTLPAWL